VGEITSGGGVVVMAGEPRVRWNATGCLVHNKSLCCHDNCVINQGYEQIVVQVVCMSTTAALRLPCDPAHLHPVVPVLAAGIYELLALRQFHCDKGT
jgi:hypothetical protein